MSQLMDAFRIGQMLGNAYGNMWVANANKRDDKKAERILNRLNSEGSEPEQKANPLTPTTEDYEQAMAANAETPSAANLQNVDLGNSLQQKAYDAIMGNKNLQPISTMAKNLGVRQNPLMDDVRKAIGVSTTISPEYEKERADVANAIAQGYTGNIDLSNRPRVRNEDGSISTVKSMSFNEDGKEVLIPQVSPDGKIMNEREAIDRYHKTGENLGKFNTVAAANEMARRIHDSEEQKLNKVENAGLNWKPNFSALDLDKAMKAEGIGKESRDRALAQYAKETAQQAQKEMLPALLERMGQENPRGAFADVLRYAQYDPTMRDVVMKDYEKALAFDNQRKLEAQRLANKMAYAEVYGGRGGRSSGSGRRTGRGGSADEEYYGSTGFNVNLDKRLKVLDGNIARIDKMLKYENLSPERRAKLETDLQRYQEEGIAIMDGTWAQQYGPSEEELLLSNPLDASNPKSVDAWSRFIQSKGDRATMSEVMGKMLGEDSDEYKRIMKNSAADYDPTDAYIGIEDVPNSSGSKESSKSESKKETPLTGKSLGKVNWVSTDGNSTIFDIVDDRYNPDGTRRKYPWQR